MQIDVYEHGVFSWVDVTSTDLEKSRKFYSDMFGWEIPPGPEEFGGYSMASVNGRMVAGVSPSMDPSVPPLWSTYVDVASVDDTLEKVTANGGNVIVPAMDVGEAGRMAVFTDPDGAAIGLWQASDHKGAGLVNEAGTWGWSELMCDDPEKEKAFYSAVFDWGAVTNGEGAGAYTEWQVGGRSIGGWTTSKRASRSSRALAGRSIGHRWRSSPAFSPWSRIRSAPPSTCSSPSRKRSRPPPDPSD